MEKMEDDLTSANPRSHVTNGPRVDLLSLSLVCINPPRTFLAYGTFILIKLCFLKKLWFIEK